MPVVGRTRAQVAAILAAAVWLCATVEVGAQTEIERCTGQSASPAIEQQYLSGLENSLKRLSEGDDSVVLQVEGVLDYATNILISLRQQSLVSTLLSARTVERIMEAASAVVHTEPTLITAWARFRLAFANSLWRAVCLDEAEKRLAAASIWPLADPDVATGIVSAHGGILSELGRLSEAVITLRPFLDTDEAPHSFTALRARFSALNNLGKALRPSNRTEAKRVYHQALALALDPMNRALIRTQEDRQTHESDLGKVYLNLAALALHNQDTNDAWSFLHKSRGALERAGKTESETMVRWLRTAADYWIEVSDQDKARRDLVEGLALAERVAPKSVVLMSELLRRIERLGVADPESLQRLIESDRALDRRPGANWNEKVESAEAISDAYAELQDWDRAVEWARIAYARIQAVTAGPTIELAMIQMRLAVALAHRAHDNGAFTDGTFANARQIAVAYDMSRAAAHTVREIGEGQAIGCRVGQERNAEMVDSIREWHGFMSSIMLQAPEIQGTPLENQIANEVLGLVQAQETDRIGAATLWAAARKRITARQAVQNYEDLVNEKCAVEEKLGRLLAAPQLEDSSLAPEWRRLAELQIDVEAALALVDPVLASALSQGRAILTHNQLGDLLLSGEGMLAFRIGGRFSVASLIMRHGDESTTVTIPLPKANFEDVEASVSAILDGIEDRKSWGFAGKTLSDMLRMSELRLVMERFGVEHVFFVPDGHLRRLPSHLLPVGTASLSDFAHSSTVASIWGFAVLRQMSITTSRSRAVYAIGNPDLYHVPCDYGFPMPETIIHREVMCLGKTESDMSALLRGAHDLLGGPMPAMGPEARRAGILGPAPQEAGILLFGTHGLIPEGKEISYLDEPALVLSPDQTDPEEDGLLLASQVADLRLDDSWLAILAACRTGTPSGTDVSDGLSGLAWGFTAAGTDALLVTQWVTYAEAAREVMLSMLRRMAADPWLSLAAALEDAMRAFADKKPDTREWGGFSILGDGTVTMPPR